MLMFLKKINSKSGYLSFKISEKIQTLEGFMLVLDVETNKRETIEIPLKRKITAKN